MICPLRKETGKLHLGLRPTSEAGLATTPSENATRWRCGHVVACHARVAQRHVRWTGKRDAIVEMLAHEHREARTGAATWLALDLEEPAGDEHRVVGRDHPFVLLTEDGVKVDPADRHERVGSVERRPTKRRVVLRHVGLAQVLIRRRHGTDTGDAELIHEPKRIASNRADDFVRYGLGREDAERIRRESERALPSVIIFRLAGAVHEFGSDTASLLRAVYETLPMLNAAPEEALDMGTVVREATAEYEVHANKAMTKSQRRDRQRRLSEIRAEVQARLARHAQIPLADQPTPRCDDVFAAGVQWLDSLAGEPAPVGEGELAIAPTFGILRP